jgi:hypothetical protein
MNHPCRSKSVYEKLLGDLIHNIYAILNDYHLTSNGYDYSPPFPKAVAFLLFDRTPVCLKHKK